MSAQQNAQAFGVVAPSFRRVTTEGDLMLMQMRKQHVGVSKLSRLVGGLGSALNMLPLVAVSAALGVWIGKMLAARTASARKTAAMKRLNAEYKLQIESIKKTRAVIAQILRLNRSEHEETLKLSRGIKTKKDARIAEAKATALLLKQEGKVIAAFDRARELSEKAEQSRAKFDALRAKSAKFRARWGEDFISKEEIAAKKTMMLDKRAATQQMNKFKLQKAVHETIAKTRTRITAKLSAFEISSTRKGSRERFDALIAATFLAKKELLARKRASREAAKLLIRAEGEKNSAVIKSKKAAFAKTAKEEKAAAAKVKALMKRGEAVSMGLSPKTREEARGIIELQIEGMMRGVTAPAARLKETLRERRAGGVMGPVAPAQTMSEFIQQPIVAMQTDLSHKLDKMIENENKIRKLIGEQSFTLNVQIGDKVISKSVKRGKEDEDESEGDIVVRKVGGAGGGAG